MSYRDPVAMMRERGISLAHTTILYLHRVGFETFAAIHTARVVLKNHD